VSSLAQLAAVRAATPGGTALNMFDKSAATSGSYVNGTTGLPVVQASWTYSGYIVANSGGTMITSASIANGVAGYAFYDQALTFISGTNTTVSAGGTITVPATAAYVRISMLTTAVATEMLVNGATLPNAYVRFTPLSQADINAAGGSAQNNVAAHFTDGQNLYNNQGLSVGVLKCADGTTDSSFSTFRTSNFMYVYGAGFVTSNTSWPTASGLYGFAFYDGNQAYLSGTCATQTTPTPIAVPAAAVYARFYEAVASSNAVVVVAGSSLPANYVGYGYSPQYTAALDANIQQVVNSALPANRNLFDQTRVTTGFELTVATGALASSVNASTSDFLPVQPGMTYNFMVAGGSVAPTFGMAYYDGYKGYIAPGPGLPITAGQVITVPAGVAYLRFCQPTSLNSVQVVTIGSTPPTNYIPFYSSGATTSTSYGKKMAWWGDSITALYGSSWQPTVVTRSGILTAFQDAHAGRSFAPASAFENYGGTCSGINLGAGGPMPNTGILGNTIAQDLAGIDGIVVELGTNDYTKTLGSPGDATTAATVYGYIRNFVECVLAAAPNIHMVMISPYNSSGRGGAGTLGVVNAIKYVAAQNSVPVIDTYNEGGINQFNWSTTIMVDGIHVTALGGSLYYGPQIAERVKRMF
jgi:lysophospholipase L1-like esterase